MHTGWPNNSNPARQAARQAGTQAQIKRGSQPYRQANINSYIRNKYTQARRQPDRADRTGIHTGSRQAYRQKCKHTGKNADKLKAGEHTARQSYTHTYIHTSDSKFGHGALAALVTLETLVLAAALCHGDRSRV